MKKYLDLFGNSGINDVIKELNKSHKMKVTDPKTTEKPTGEKIRASLQYLVFLKQKICGTVKICGLSDGQR